jgi:uncharacterized protein YndB with AHSA1/START domain
MRSELRVLAGVIAFFLAPLVVIAVDPHRESLFYKVAMFVLLAIAVVLYFVTSSLQPKKGPGQPIDERRSDRFMNLLPVLGASVIAALGLVGGISDVRTGVIFYGIFILSSVTWLPSLTRRFAVTTQVFIDRDPKSVFTFMLDGRNQMRYVPDLVSVEKITEGDIGPGTQFRSVVRMDGRGVFEGVEQIVDVDWGRRIVERVANGTRPNRGILTFTPEQAGTLMTYRFESEVSYPGAVFGQGVFRWAMTGEMRRRRMAIWARLKQVLESGAGA